MEIIGGYGEKEGIRTPNSLHLVAALDVNDAAFLSADKFLSGFVVKMGFRIEKV